MQDPPLCVPSERSLLVNNGVQIKRISCSVQPRAGALTISFAPSAEALCDALVVNGRRLPAVMRPPAAPAGR
jgi:hypothetical protein